MYTYARIIIQSEETTGLLDYLVHTKYSYLNTFFIFFISVTLYDPMDLPPCIILLYYYTMEPGKLVNW